MIISIDYITEDGRESQIRSLLPEILLFRLDREQKQVIESEDGVTVIVLAEENRLICDIKSDSSICLKRAVLECDFRYGLSEKIFVNGYQSWTETKEYLPSVAIHNLDKVPGFIKNHFHFENYGDPWFVKYDKNVIHGFTYSYVEMKSNNEPDANKCYLIGSLNEDNAYLIIKHIPARDLLIIESDISGRRVKGEFRLFDFVRLTGDKIQIQREYFELFGRCDAKPIRGYTSWYKHYQNIDEAKVLSALEGIDSDNYDVFQIDDGFETFVGDWFDIDKKKFPNGLKLLVDKIHEKGLKAGIWLAPFVAEKKSRLFSEHPDWLLKRNGEIVYAGCNWSGDAALDIRKEEVQNYVKDVLNYYMDLGFDLFKLDFLYAAALCAGDSLKMGDDSDGSATRAEIMRGAMTLLRDTLVDRQILGCGVPLSSAFNLVDYCRVGPDISLSFDDTFYMRPMHRERVSTKVTLQNTIYRSCMDGTVFRCDPDVYLLRDEKISLSKPQREAVAKLNHLCGAVYFTSDNVADYDAEKKNLLESARELADGRLIDISRMGNEIHLSADTPDGTKTIIYNTDKGVLING